MCCACYIDSQRFFGSAGVSMQHGCDIALVAATSRLDALKSLWTSHAQLTALRDRLRLRPAKRFDEVCAIQPSIQRSCHKSTVPRKPSLPAAGTNGNSRNNRISPASTAGAIVPPASERRKDDASHQIHEQGGMSNGPHISRRLRRSGLRKSSRQTRS